MDPRKRLSGQFAVGFDLEGRRCESVPGLTNTEGVDDSHLGTRTHLA